MPRYWIIAPIESSNAERFEKVWQFDLTNGFVSIGWQQLGDISKMSRETLSQAVASTFPEKPPQTKSLLVNMLWAFYHEISAGDFVIARKGRKTLAAIGKVAGPASYKPNKNPAAPHSHFLEIQWLPSPRDKTFPMIVFPMHTLSETSEEQYRHLLEGSITQSVAREADEEIDDPNAFVLERYLEDFIVTNFQTIFKGKLVIFQDVDGADGQQYATDIGPIDILAVEPGSNALVVIELKKGRPSDKVVGQILRYMGWVKQNLSKPDQPVKGLVICSSPDPKLAYALTMTKGIDVKYYTVSFKLSETAS
jgi:restriction system protein